MTVSSTARLTVSSDTTIAELIDAAIKKERLQGTVRAQLPPSHRLVPAPDTHTVVVVGEGRPLPVFSRQALLVGTIDQRGRHVHSPPRQPRCRLPL